MSTVVGIDLGTSASMVATRDGAGVRLLPDAHGDAALPSVVHFGPDGEVCVGEEARIRAPAAPHRTLYDFVPLLGRPFSGHASLAAHALLPTRLEETPGGGIGVRVDGAVHALTRVGALLLGALRNRSGGARGARVVVPAAAGSTRRRALMAAARHAGFEHVRLTSAPLAIAAARAAITPEPGRWLVVDLGASGAEAAVVEVGDGAVELQAVRAVPGFGGRSIDLAIADELADQCVQTHSIDPRSTPAAVESLRSHAEWAKAELSERDVVAVDIPGLIYTEEGPVNLRGRLDRLAFEGFVADAAQRVTGACAELVSDLGVSRLDALVLAGGFSRCRPVRVAIESWAGLDAADDLDPETAAVAGAAQMAADGQTRYIDGCWAPVRVGRRDALIVVPAGMPLPVRMGRLCAADRAPVRIWQGPADDIDSLVGELRVEGPSRVVVDMDENGLLELDVEPLAARSLSNSTMPPPGRPV